ncbi:MAG TPA: NADH-quinone oxidoreductase subunit N [Verrucomicrobiae bacterium]|nr:NADH-quinone oxidoreductase subunit N [Verrucomicrobiae bacterium]
MSYSELLALAAPETIVVIAALAVLAADLFALREVEVRVRQVVTGMIACLGCVVAIGWILVLPARANIMSGIFVVDPIGQLVKVALLGLTIATVLLSMEADFSVHTGEYFALVLLATVGMMFLVSSADVLMIFVALELTSLSLYVLTAFNKSQVQSAEAALKYFLFGGMAAALTLFGLSLLYGLAGSTSLERIAAALRGRALDPLLLLALVLTICGFGFKVAVAPFHLWAPDVYQGAPAPSAAFIASGSKVAGFFVLARVLAVGFNGAEGSGDWHAYLPGWVPLVAAIAGLSMVIGNFAALAQTSVRRLVAYSAVAHGGYMLLGVMAHNGPGLASLVYYVITYAITTLGAFGVIAIVQQQTGGDKLTDFAALSRRSPGLALCMMVFILSLAGIPPLAGFFGKFYVFSELLRGNPASLGLLWLVVLAIGLSAVSLYYYLQVLKQIFVANEQPGSTLIFKPSPIQHVMVAVLALAVIALGCWPEWLIGRLAGAVALAGF